MAAEAVRTRADCSSNPALTTFLVAHPADTGFGAFDEPMDERVPMPFKLVQHVVGRLVQVGVLVEGRDQGEVCRVAAHDDQVRLDMLHKLEEHFQRGLVLEREVDVAGVHDGDEPAPGSGVVQPFEPRTLIGVQVDAVDVRQRGGDLLRIGRGHRDGIRRLEHVERVEHRLGVVLAEDVARELAVFLYPALQVDAGRFHVQFFDGA